MLDIIIIILAAFSSISQIIVSCGISFNKFKCKKNKLYMVTNLWFDYIPHLLFIYSIFFILYAIKFSDTVVLLTVISLTIVFIFNIQILIYNKESITLISFPFKKEKYNTFIFQDKILVVENDRNKEFIRLSKTKTNLIKQTMNKEFL